MTVPTTGRSRPTLEQVAARAGVSRATVSRVVNGSPKVSPKVRDVVNRAIEELGYVPNPAARTLVTQRTDAIALVVSEPESRVFTDPHFGSITRGVSECLNAADKQLVLIMARSPEDHRRLERYVAAGHVDGVLLVSLHRDDPLPRTLMRLGVPTVSGGRPPRPAPGLRYVDMDNVGSGRKAAEYLLAQGRRRIATIAGPPDMSAGVDRLTGFREALGPARYRRSLVEYGAFTRESGERAMAALLDREPDLDAVFAASDLMADGALRALRRAGRRVPDDVAVIGFDDSPIARHTQPPLTSVRQPIETMGREMTRLLLARMNGDEVASQQVIVNTRLVVRASG